VYVILKVLNNEIEEFVVYNKTSKMEVARYSTYAEAFDYLLSR